MKSTGIVRKVDELGRIVLPIEMRRTLNIAEKEPLEIFIEDSKIILKKYIPEGEESAEEKKYICSVCRNEIDAAQAKPVRIRARVKPGKR